MLGKPLVGILAFASTVKSHQNPCFSETCNINFPKTDLVTMESVLDDTSKFHVGMLSISLIVGLAYGGFVAYCCWVKENILLSHIRNLVIALVCRTFFTLLIHAVIVLQGSQSVGGNNTLVAFEIIALNLVVSYWLYLTIYLHARVQRNFNSEPNLKLYQYGIPCVGGYFAFVWIFVMAGEFNFLTWFQTLWWPAAHWITSSIQLLYLLIQLGLVGDMGRMVTMKYSLDNDSTSLLRKIAAFMGIMVFLFWLHFGLSVGRPSTDGYLYFYYLIGGLQCAALCPIFYFFEKWVGLLLNKISHVSENVAETTRARQHRSDNISIESCIGPGIVTIDSLLTEQENGNWRGERQIIEERKDVVYSSVVQPENLKKTIDLYKRLNVLPKNDVTIIGGEEFYECLSERKNSSISEASESTSKPLSNLALNHSRISYEERTVRKINKRMNNLELNHVKKKNAFYASKYLIVEPKEKDFPKYLESRPSISITDEENFKGDRKSSDSYTTSEKSLPDESVKYWLNECSSQTERKFHDQMKSSQHKSDLDFQNNKQKESNSEIVNSSTNGRTSQTSETSNQTTGNIDCTTASIVDNKGQKILNPAVQVGSNDPP